MKFDAKTVDLVSVPLSGLTSVNCYRIRYMLDYIVSVPLSGLTSVNNMSGRYTTILWTESFRPLIGVNFCKLLLIFLNSFILLLFPSPYRG